MIHLDTNVLIRLPHLAEQGHPFLNRLGSGEPIGMSAIAWFEFCSGLEKGISAEEHAFAMALVGDHLMPFDEVSAALAARLFNSAGRRRRLKSDACIAATAIRAGAEFATLNGPDFEPFVPLGLRLLALEP
ncbi:PIN domain-containing protein [Nevskia sp.]|uniref:type II toxin-antitoxin system VapC family toxin n=1 Tax=Nevskia sp. TaxID=1929292 RepID=UPI0025E5ED1B|nr:PIN domain-containing protein [Nevskia sp.]